MAIDPDLLPPPDTAESVQATRPDQLPPLADDPYQGQQYDPPFDKNYWLACLSDAERAEEKWRQRGRQIIQIYRNETTNARTGQIKTGGITFNVLYANTEVMLPAVYQKPPKPVVRSRFTQASKPQPPMPPIMPPGMPPPGMGMPDIPLPGGPP